MISNNKVKKETVDTRQSNYCFKHILPYHDFDMKIRLANILYQNHIKATREKFSIMLFLAVFPILLIIYQKN